MVVRPRLNEDFFFFQFDFLVFFSKISLHLIGRRVNDQAGELKQMNLSEKSLDTFFV